MPAAETEPGLDYPALLRMALLGVVRDVLRRVADEGLPGDHHFYVSFHTQAPDVGLSARLRQQYPEEMTIVLQHQFEDLEVGADSFSVTLRFGGVPERLVVPYAALSTFADPAAGFGLRFDPGEAAPSVAVPPAGGSAPADPDVATGASATVLPFRKADRGADGDPR